MNRSATWKLVPHLSYLAAAGLIGATGCIGYGSDWDEIEAVDEDSEAIVIPAKGTATTLDICSWNIEWFGDAANGPSNETQQLNNVRDVISGADMDIWGVEEVVSATQFNSLLAQLSGYTGFLANDPSVVNGPAYYSDFSNAEQKVGLIYKSSMVTITSRKVILTANDYDFGGRPPLEVGMNVTLNGSTQSIIVIVQHAKCCSDSTSHQRRTNASNALKAYLDATYPTQKVWVLGDFNDDLDTSITPGSPSPYANFVADSADYTFPSKVLTDAGISTTAGYPDAIDHHLTTNEAYATYVAGSVEAYRVDSYIPSYSTTTTDHFPVLSRYTWSGGGSPTVTVAAPNGGESFVGGSSTNITWTSSGFTNVKLEYSLNGGAGWSLITASTPASAGTLAWTVPNSASTNAFVRASDAANAAIFDLSNAAFTITAGGGPANVILNEVLANEAGSDTAGEFVELVNVGGSSANIAGWTISDGSQVRHTFPAGTTLLAGKAIVVFGGASAIPGGLTNAAAASTGTLSLANGSDSVTVKDGSGAVKGTHSWSSTPTDGLSKNRSPDGSAAGSFANHNTVGTGNTSPGKRANQTAW
ncbi:lamin tail domain-containing protein [Sorangium sp. So ce726]|uniref:lamin tail domain-containing protein n=1 Tax=Sorangium sp. So ce726 TaxID=3133319 RepID=UPI003F5DB4EA